MPNIKENESLNENEPAPEKREGLDNSTSNQTFAQKLAADYIRENPNSELLQELATPKVEKEHPKVATQKNTHKPITFNCVNSEDYFEVYDKDARNEEGKTPGIGVWVIRHLGKNDKGEDQWLPPMFVCGLLTVEGCGTVIKNKSTIAESQNEFGFRLKWRDKRGDIQTKFINDGDLQKDVKDLRVELASRGLKIALKDSRQKDYFAHFLFTAKDKAKDKYLVAIKRGWYESAPGVWTFQTANHSYKTKDNPMQIICDPGKEDVSWDTVKGTLQEWREHISIPALWHPGWVFAICVPFAAPLLHILNPKSESKLFQLGGHSSNSKTTGGQIAQSVIGAPDGIQGFAGTYVGRERACISRNDGFIVLDELQKGRGSIQNVGEQLYLIANGKGLVRSDKSLSLKTPETWINLVLVTGEKTIEELYLDSEVKEKPKAGMLQRLYYIPVDFVKDKTPPEGFNSSREFVDYMKVQCGNYYGAPWKFYLQFLVDIRTYIGTQALAETIQTYVNEFVDYVLELKKDLKLSENNQVQRAISYFGIVYAAGEIISGNYLYTNNEGKKKCIPPFTGWRRTRHQNFGNGKLAKEDLGDSAKAVLQCCLAYLDRESADSDELEYRREIRRITSIFTEQLNHFADLDDKNETKSPRDCYGGYRRQGYDQDSARDFYLLPMTWKEVICKGNPDRIEPLLLSKGWEIDKKATRRFHHVPFDEKARKYVKVVLPGENIEGEVIDIEPRSDEYDFTGRGRKGFNPDLRRTIS
ncbi:MAG: DUF927 domain-containing protein [Clostridiales bacterium]|nr:DUF927 domain-containing protein [Clostridiales bacterium]